MDRTPILALVLLGLAGCSERAATSEEPTIVEPAVDLPAQPEGSTREANVEFTPLDYPEARPCPIVSSTKWSARIEEGETQNFLWVDGVVATNPNVDFQVVLDPEVMESDPVQRRARLLVTHPPGANIDRLDPHYPQARLAYEGDLGIVALECEGTLLATISDPLER